MKVTPNGFVAPWKHPITVGSNLMRVVYALAECRIVGRYGMASPKPGQIGVLPWLEQPTTACEAVYQRPLLILS